MKLKKFKKISNEFVLKQFAIFKINLIEIIINFTNFWGFLNNVLNKCKTNFATKKNFAKIKNKNK